jgi:galactose mutarotase-like enzyme
MYFEMQNDKLHVSIASRGGELNSIKDNNDIEYLWQGDARYWSGHSPVLFPICGSIRDDKAILEDGRTVNMPRHGIVRKSEFDCDFHTENQIQFSIKNNEKMLEPFPFRFKLEILYELVNSCLTVTYKVINQDELEIPFCIGGHPGFNCPLLEGERFEEYVVELDKKETCSIPTPVTSTGLINMESRTEFLVNENIISMNHELFQVDAVILDDIQSKKIRMYHKDTQKGVQVAFEDFSYLVLWSSPNEGAFLAIEPWNGLSTCSDEGNVFEQKRAILKVKPQEEKKLKYSITVL